MTDSNPPESRRQPPPDRGLTHCALECLSLDRSIPFYERFGGFEVVHRRPAVAWISDRTRPFALVLVETSEVRPIGPFAHLGFACGSRAEFDRLIELARAEGSLRDGPHEGNGPAGTWAFLDDPDGNTFELSVGQSVEVAIAVEPSPQGGFRRTTIGVMGSGDDEHPKLAEPLGEAIARAGFELLTGGGGGTMTAVSRGFTRVGPRAGRCVAILRGDASGVPLPGYPNRFVENPIFTHLPAGGVEHDSRNHLNVLSSDIIIALPGGFGTGSEIELSIRYRKPVIVHEFWVDRFPGLPCWNDIEEAMAFVDTRRSAINAERNT
ncbi:MAG: VOC family protein [Phycisphaerales bacterium]|nr:VOC family protein [Phycisphaerales bacterium]